MYLSPNATTQLSFFFYIQCNEYITVCIRIHSRRSCRTHRNASLSFLELESRKNGNPDINISFTPHFWVLNIVGIIIAVDATLSSNNIEQSACMV